LKKIKLSTRLIVAFASLLMILTYYFPLWQIWLSAPQYPEGLGLQIWINKIDGQVDIINGLNHYIGMKFIKQETFPELQFMPYLIGALIGLGLLTAIIGRRFLLVIFCILVVGTGIAGAIDYNLWAYNYGHHLDPTAPIKVPGMSYQPPFLGTKELLNFTATAWPGIGGISIFVAAFVVFIVTVFELWKKKKSENIYNTKGY
jgi:copper chaperone NosL